MTNEGPVEPSAVFDAHGIPVVYREQPRPAPAAAVRRSLQPVLARAAAAGPLLTTAAFLATGAAAVKVAEMAGRMMRQTARGAVDVGGGRQGRLGGVEVSWTHVEIRWPV